MVRTIFKDLVPEGSTRIFRATLKDYLGVALDPVSVTAIVLTLRDVATGNIVNGRTAQDVKNANGGTLASGGAFAMVFGPLDTASLSSAQRQDRRATLKVTYTNGVETHEVQFTVFNMADIA